jgi:hypothetical protein
VIHLESSEAKNAATGPMLGCGLPGAEASVGFAEVKQRRRGVWVSYL